MSQTLIEDLIDVVDEARGQHAELGTRPYTVRICTDRWSGGARGRGLPSRASTTVLVPTPKVEGLTELREVLLQAGRNEQGEIVVSEISLRYQEQDLLPRSVPDDVSLYYEVELSAREGSDVLRFFPAGRPVYQPQAVGWTIRLRNQQGGDPVQRRA